MYYSANLNLSVVIPAYNEEKSIKPLYEKLISILKALNRRYEIIFIDDGSTDGTFDEIQKLATSDNTISYIQFRKNFGKAIALSCGFAQACGDIIVTLDADLQDDPAEIPRLIDKIDEGWDLVSGWRKIREDTLEKKLPSRLFNIVVSRITGIRLHDINCGLKAYKKETVKTIKIYGELYRFIPLLAFNHGFKVCEISVKHYKRKFGISKYGKNRYLAGIFDFFSICFLMSYQSKPLHFLGKISFASFFLGMLLIGYVCLMKFVLGQTGNRPTLTAGVFFWGLAVQIFLFGLLAELVTYTGYSNNFRHQDFINQKLIRR